MLSNQDLGQNQRKTMLLNQTRQKPETCNQTSRCERTMSKSKSETGYGKRKLKSDSRFWISAPGFRVPDSEFQTTNSRFQTLDSGFRILDSGLRVPVPDSGVWSSEFAYPGCGARTLLKNIYENAFEADTCSDQAKTMLLNRDLARERTNE